MRPERLLCAEKGRAGPGLRGEKKKGVYVEFGGIKSAFRAGGRKGRVLAGFWASYKGAKGDHGRGRLRRRTTKGLCHSSGVEEHKVLGSGIPFEEELEDNERD